MLTRDDVEALADEYRERGIVRIASFLPGDQASDIHAHLRGRDDWRQVFNSGDKLFELDREARAGMEPAKLAALDEASMPALGKASNIATKRSGRPMRRRPATRATIWSFGLRKSFPPARRATSFAR